MHKLDEAVEDILKHWGVKGMKWDEEKRKKQEEEEEKKEKDDEVSEADRKLINDVIRGNYGNGEERKQKLGKRYREIQDMVNEQLKTGSPVKKKVKPKSKPKSKKGTPSYQHTTVQSARKMLKAKPAKKKVHPSYQHATVQSAKKKLKPKNKARSKSYLQKLKSKTVNEIQSLFSKFFN